MSTTTGVASIDKVLKNAYDIQTAVEIGSQFEKGDYIGGTTAAVKVLSPSLGKVFGKNGQQVGDFLTAAFNDPGMVKKFSEPPTFTYKLAPVYGDTITSGAIQTMDDNLKIIIAGTVKALDKRINVEGQQLTWDEVLSVMSNNVLIQPMDISGKKPNVMKNDRYVNSSTDVFKIDGSPSDSMVADIKSWFYRLIDDEDVIKSTTIDDSKITVMARIVAETGAHVGNAEQVVTAKEYEEREMFDLGVLRFPDIDNPFFKVYRLRLVATRSCTRILMVEKNENALNVEYNCRCYEPRPSVLDGIKAEVRAKAIAEAEDMF